MSVGIVCSHGGHLTQMVFALKAIQGKPCFAIVQDVKTLSDLKIEGVKTVYHLKTLFAYSYPFGVAVTMLFAMFRFIRIFLKERPKVLLSTGAEIAVPAFYLAKFLFGTKLLFLESVTRRKTASLTGKLLYPIADLFLVQDPAMVECYGPKAVYGGSLL